MGNLGVCDKTTAIFLALNFCSGPFVDALLGYDEVASRQLQQRLGATLASQKKARAAEAKAKEYEKAVAAKVKAELQENAASSAGSLKLVGLPGFEDDGADEPSGFGSRRAGGGGAKKNKKKKKKK